MRKSNLCVVFEPASRLSGGQVPQAQSLVPGTRKGVVAVAGEDYVGDKMRMAVETLLRNAVLGFFTCQFPDDEGFVWNAKS